MNLLVCICCKRDSASIVIWPVLSANFANVSNKVSYKGKTLPTESDFELHLISVQHDIVSLRRGQDAVLSGFLKTMHACSLVS